VLCIRTAGGLSEADYVSMLLDQQVSGVVFAGGHHAEQAAPHDHYRLLRSRGIPAVLFNASADDLDFPCVSTDDMTAAGQAYTHLASLGHQRIGLVAGPEDHMPSRRKLAAFTAHAERTSGSAAVEHALFSLEGGRPPPPGCCGTASPASSAPATCWPSARSGPSGGRACPCPATSRWSATTTPRS
jgi:DNA-binding LacI/PurR family transcriptional regulator